MKKLVIVALVGAIVVLGVWLFAQKKEEAMSLDIKQTKENKTYTLDEIGQHNSKDDCWLAIEGKVYDVTSFVKGGFHPGKEAILQGCGRDASELFNTRPMGSKTPHSERARAMLPKYYIGELSK